MEFLKTLTGRIATGLIALGVVAGAISWWQMDPATRQMLVTGTVRILGWLGIILAFPWVSFALIARVARLESNLAGGLLIFGYTLAETILLAWLFNWHVSTPAGWTFLLMGGLLAGVYNLLACDWIAEKLE